jgi:phosphatidylserine/phosphatidylglycerophosphate/cardiolipin synthase-like enzyme
MFVDDEFVRVGSSNLSNRSMGLDTECDIAIEANGHAEHKKAIIRFRNGLLAEHLGTSPDEIARMMDEKGSMLQAIQALRNDTRTLEPIDDAVPGWIERLIPANPFFDPDRAIPIPRRLIRWVTRPGVLVGVALGVSFWILLKKKK